MKLFTTFLAILFIGFTVADTERDGIVHSYGLYSENDPVQNYAILIGINDYRAEKLRDLQNPLRDISEIAVELRERYGFNVDTLQNPTRARMIESFKKIRYAYDNFENDPNGQLLVFLSGHGIYDDFSETGYFLPADCNPADLDGTAFPYDKWRRYINSLDCRHVLVMIDACFSGTFDEEIAMRSGGERGFNRPGEPSSRDKLIWEHEKRTTRLFMASGAKEETPDKSGFSKQLLKALRSGGEKDRILTIDAVYALFMKEARPTPIFREFGDNDPGSGFLFMEGGIPGQKIDPMEDLLWSWVVQQENSKAFAFFLDMYPDGFYKDEAKSIYDRVVAADSTAVFPAGGIIYVKQGSKGHGASWADAYGDLQPALQAAKAGSQIWVSEGTYFPTQGNDRNAFFNIPSDVQLYGGFSGSEDSLSQRDWKQNITILSGEIGSDSPDDNSFTILYTRNSGINTIIDGFVITGGNANGTDDEKPLELSGGGWFNDGADGNSSPEVSNCRFLNNHARNGGAVFSRAPAGVASPLIEGCEFLGNSADFEGGAIHNDCSNGKGDPIIRNCRFENNEATYGAGIFNKADNGVTNPNIHNCEFIGNLAYIRGSSIYNNSASEVGLITPIMQSNQFIDNASNIGSDGGSRY